MNLLHGRTYDCCANRPLNGLVQPLSELVRDRERHEFAPLAVEQFGYGFGFTAYMLYMMMLADGPHKTAHYAICTGFMALGMMLPGMAAGWIEDHIGYVNFFTWVLVCTIPSFIVITRLKIDPAFGKKAPEPATE